MGGQNCSELSDLACADQKGQAAVVDDQGGGDWDDGFKSLDGA